MVRTDSKGRTQTLTSVYDNFNSLTGIQIGSIPLAAYEYALSHGLLAGQTYDPYGNTVTATGILAEFNPLRYRGYVHEDETGWYYVSSRYYDPQLRRFINADAIELIGANGDFVSVNLFAYCGNNPIIREDKGGQFWNLVAGAVSGAVISGLFQVVDNLLNGSDWSDGLASAMASGAITGVMAASGADIATQALISGFVSAGTDYFDQAARLGKDNVDANQVILSGLSGVVSGLIGGKGIQHKSGDLSHAKGLYNYTIDKIENRFWSADKAGKYLELAAKNLQNVWKKELITTTIRYAAGVGGSTVAKKAMIGFIRR